MHLSLILKGLSIHSDMSEFKNQKNNQFGHVCFEIILHLLYKYLIIYNLKDSNLIHFLNTLKLSVLLLNNKRQKYTAYMIKRL